MVRLTSICLLDMGPISSKNAGKITTEVGQESIKIEEGGGRQYLHFNWSMVSPAKQGAL